MPPRSCCHGSWRTVKTDACWHGDWTGWGCWRRLMTRWTREPTRNRSKQEYETKQTHDRWQTSLQERAIQIGDNKINAKSKYEMIAYELVELYDGIKFFLHIQPVSFYRSFSRHRHWINRGRRAFIVQWTSHWASLVGKMKKESGRYGRQW